MAVNADRLRRDLGALDSTETKIKPLSTYMQLNDPQTCTKLWIEAVESGRAESMLPLLYLANDVIQCTLQKKQDAYMKEMARYLEAAFSAAVKKSPEHSGAYERLLSLWQARTIYSSSFLARVRQAMATAHAELAAAPPPAPAPPPVPSEDTGAEPGSRPFSFSMHDEEDEVGGEEAGVPAASGAGGQGGGGGQGAAAESSASGAGLDPSLAAMADAFYSGESVSTHSTSAAWGGTGAQGQGQGPAAGQQQEAAVPAYPPLPPVPTFHDPDSDVIGQHASLPVLLGDMRRVHAVRASARALLATVRPELTHLAPGKVSLWEAQGGLAHALGGQVAPSLRTQMVHALADEASSAEQVGRVHLASALLVRDRLQAYITRLESLLQETARAMSGESEEVEGMLAAQGVWSGLASAQAAGNTVRVEKAGSLPHAQHIQLHAPQPVRVAALHPAYEPGAYRAAAQGGGGEAATGAEGAGGVGGGYQPHAWVEERGEAYQPQEQVAAPAAEGGVSHASRKRGRAAAGGGAGAGEGEGAHGSSSYEPTLEYAPQQPVHAAVNDYTPGELQPVRGHGPVAYLVSLGSGAAVAQAQAHGVGQGQGQGVGGLPSTTTTTTSASASTRASRLATAQAGGSSAARARAGAAQAEAESDMEKAKRARALAAAGGLAHQFLHLGAGEDEDEDSLAEIDQDTEEEGASAAPKFTFDPTGAGLGAEGGGRKWDAVHKEWVDTDKVVDAEHPEAWRR